jgi:hypothetical protein
MELIIVILAAIAFWLIAYYIGNLAMDTFDWDFSDRIASTFMGILLMAGFMFITYLISYFILTLIK